MTGRPRRGSSARRRAAAAAVCSVLAVVVGGALLAAPADASGFGASDACSSAAPTTLIDTTGAGSGVVDLGSANGPVGSTSSTTGAGAGLVDCAAGVTTATRVSRIAVLRSSNTVYPVKDGYRDSVRFAVHAMDAAGALVPVVGEAVLTKAGRSVDTWHISGSTETLTWNGRVGHRIETGLYALKVTARSTDGSTRVGRALVRVLDKHLVQHAVTVRSVVGARSVSADMPHELLKAYATGKVTCRVVTVATVHGPAKLVFRNHGVSRSVTLRNGSHTTRALPVPQGFSRVTIIHDWAKGAAHLTSLRAIWTYSTLS